MSVAVIEGAQLHYLGEDKQTALSIFESKPGSKMVNVATLNELQSHLQGEGVKACCTEPDCEHTISEAFRRVLDKLDENGINAENADELRKKLQAGGEKLAADVRSLGLRGMRIVGDGLTALGDFMRKASDDEEKVAAQSTEENGGSCCGGGNCDQSEQ